MISGSAMKLLKYPGLLLLSLLSIPAFAWDVSDLMKTLASNPGGKATFTEKRQLAVLDKPLIMTGDLVYAPPAYLEKKVLTPKPEILILDGDRLRYEAAGKKASININTQPELVGFIDSIRGTLTGNQRKLEDNYVLTLSGTPKRWTLILLPNDQQIAKFVSKITISGHGDKVTTIEYLQTDGDKSVMTIQPAH